MFDFEKLQVYGRIRELNKILLPVIFENQKDYPYLCDQLKRASLSVMFNLSEGVGRMSDPDKRSFYVRSRGSVYECVSIIHVMWDIKVLNREIHDQLYQMYTQVSKMLLGLIRATEKK